MKVWCFMRNIAILWGRGLAPDAANPNTYKGLRIHIRKCMQALCEDDAWPEPPEWGGEVSISPACEAIAAIHSPATETPAIRVILMQVIEARAKWDYGDYRSSGRFEVDVINQIAAIRELGTQAVLNWHEALMRRYAAAIVCKKVAKRAPSAEKACSEIQAELKAELLSALDLALPDIHSHMIAKTSKRGPAPVAFGPAPVAFGLASEGTQATANVEAVVPLALTTTDAALTTTDAALTTTDAAAINAASTDAATVATDAAGAVAHAAVPIASDSAVSDAVPTAASVASAIGGVMDSAADCLSEILP
jgi:hypothetical protein